MRFESVYDDVLNEFNKTKNPLTAVEIAESLGVATSTVNNHIKQAVDRGTIIALKPEKQKDGSRVHRFKKKPTFNF